KPWPDGVRMAKIHWKAVKSKDAPAATTVPGDLDDVDFMLKDSKRFADGDGWGYAQFNYNPASGSFTPLGTGTQCGTACHALAKTKDYVFTSYGKR
ncbi:MAG TPA: cytochrome P460 family protein, partial [Rhizomicrobium sp.]|nr:cytochrome P460 family protein [Rhizomicrobium sp.]